MSSETEREAFEAWYGTEYGDDLQRDALGDYAHGALVLQWEAWQARAAIAVQPPAASQPNKNIRDVIDAARRAMDASTENGDDDIIIPSHLAASLSLCLDVHDDLAAVQGKK